MKVIKYISILLLTAALPVVAASLAQQKLAAPKDVKTQAASAAVVEPKVSAEDVKAIDDLLAQIAVPKSIADYASEFDWEKVKELLSRPGIDVDAKDQQG